MRRIRRFSIAVVFTLSVGCSQNGSSSGRTFTGLPLKTTSFTCLSEEVTETGYVRDLESGRVELVAEVNRQSRESKWQVVMTDSLAAVRRYSAATQSLEPVELYKVEKTSGGLLLIWEGRGVGQSPQLITIDSANSSFLYSSQHVDPMANKTNVFFGYCLPDGPP